MEASAMALGHPISYSSSYISTFHSSSSKDSKFLCGSVCISRIGSVSEMLSSRFADQSHLQYYSSKSGCSSLTVVSGKNEKGATTDKPLKKKKKQLKLLKGLTRDLSTFSQIGFGLGSDSALLDQVKGNMITEAAEGLIEQLQKIRAEEKEQKRKMKAEKAKLKAASQMQRGARCGDSSSSSSSDSECGEVIDMNKLKQTNAARIASEQQVMEVESSMQTAPITPTIPSNEERTEMQPSSSSNVEMGSSSLISDMEPSCSSNAETGSSSLIFPTCSKKIEVCMGGKCKKSGGAELLEELQRAVGIEGVVSGCKCMGKCRDGPNLKVVNEFDGEVVGSPVRAPANSLCIGVGLEDVNIIVANFLGDSHCEGGLTSAAPA